jgi:hypothetical protein
MKYDLRMTVFYEENKRVIICQPNSRYNLKKVIGDFVSDCRNGKSFEFWVKPVEEENAGIGRDDAGKSV